ncbi:hypothetical protein GJ496_001620 [Pomphorhynchus laevis]|nr:hypothetical protein GJ496_001620 [Pomphorhynchus laevis]
MTAALTLEHPKIIKLQNAKLNEVELSTAQLIMELETTVSELKALRELYIVGAKTVQYTKGREALIVYVPVSLLPKFRIIQKTLVAELEKRLGHYVIVVGWRRILPKPSKKNKIKQNQKRPRSRTLTSVHEAILHDIVYPIEIVGKRTRVKLDGSKLLKIHLDKNPENDDKIEAFSLIYKKLTGKHVVFEFPEYIL